MRSSRIRSFAAGVFIANSAPHFATAIAGRRHLTPLAGRESGPAVNAAWAALNLTAGALLLLPSRRDTTSRWDNDLIAFGSGYLLFATWMAGTERVFPVNHNT